MEIQQEREIDKYTSQLNFDITCKLFNSAEMHNTIALADIYSRRITLSTIASLQLQDECHYEVNLPFAFYIGRADNAVELIIRLSPIIGYIRIAHICKNMIQVVTEDYMIIVNGRRAYKSTREKGYHWPTFAKQGPNTLICSMQFNDSKKKSTNPWSPYAYYSLCRNVILIADYITQDAKKH